MFPGAIGYPLEMDGSPAIYISSNFKMVKSNISTDRKGKEINDSIPSFTICMSILLGSY